MARFVDNVFVRGAGLSRQLIESVISADLSGSMTEINQISITFQDPGWKLLSSGLFSINSSVDLEDYAMEISSVETGDSSGIENVTIRCRSRVIRKLKLRRGARVLKNASPTEFIISECKAVGAKYKVQPTSKRKQVARDVPKKGQQEVDNPPSSWTTFKRFAEEEGFVMFETAGTVYFGRPSWLVSEGGMPYRDFRYKLGPDGDARMYNTPRASRSADSPSQSITFQTHAQTANTIRTGMRFGVQGVPTFEAIYLVTSFSADLTDPRNLVDITGGLPLNEDPSIDVPIANRRGTRLASDFVYWVRKQLGDKYVTNIQVALGSGDPNAFNGAELAQWAAAQVGVSLPEGADRIIEFCEASGTIISVAGAAGSTGALLWRKGHIGISLGKGQVVESVNGKVGIRKGGATSRYTRGALVPFLKY